MKDAEPAMIVRSEGAMSPSTEEVVFPLEEIHFVHKILSNMVIEGGCWWFAEWGGVYPAEMQLEGDIVAEVGKGGLEGVKIG